MQTKLPFKLLNEKIELNIWTWNINCIQNKTPLIECLLFFHHIDILFLIIILVYGTVINLLVIMVSYLFTKMNYPYLYSITYYHMIK